MRSSRLLPPPCLEMAKHRKPRFHGLFTGSTLRVPGHQELRYAEQGAIALHTLFADNRRRRRAADRRRRHACRDRRALRAARHGERRRRRRWCRSRGTAAKTHELVTYDADLYDLAGRLHPARPADRVVQGDPRPPDGVRPGTAASPARWAPGPAGDSKPRALTLRGEPARAAGRRRPAHPSPRQPPTSGLGKPAPWPRAAGVLPAAGAPGPPKRCAPPARSPSTGCSSTSPSGSSTRPARCTARPAPTLRGTLDGELTWPVFTPGNQLPVGLPRPWPKRR